MKKFRCQNCGNTLYFHNDQCLNCGHDVGYIAALFDMSSLEPNNGSWRPAADGGQDYRHCDNSVAGGCNWIIPTASASRFCLACSYNRTIPDLSRPELTERWRQIELAKKYLFYSLTRLGLPIPDRSEDAERGLAFEFLAHVENPGGPVETVITGHDSGIITLDVAEADDAERETRRTTLNEPYRTLIGHFRHEIGHFYWDLLVPGSPWEDEFRTLFGDFGSDYQAALERHYQNGPPAGWQADFISAYASMHPWEDFAETWAHCLHMIDGLETAFSIGIVLDPQRSGSPAIVPFDPYSAASFDPILHAWVPLALATNSISRSLGHRDLYPFILSETIRSKLDFVFRLMQASRR